MRALIPAWVDGKITPVDKMEVHLSGLRHKAISVFVMDGNRTLLQRRALEKYHTPGLWANTCCTHPMIGEPAADCASRRLAEELGITGLTLRLADQVEYRAPVGKGMVEHEVVDIFISKMPATRRFSANPAEVMETRWITLAELTEDVAKTPAHFTPWLRIYLEKHSNRIFGPAHTLVA